MISSSSVPQPIRVSGARIELQMVKIGDHVILDEVHLEGGDVRIDPSTPNSEARVVSEESRVRVVMSEASLNQLANEAMPADAAVRSLHVALLSGRARISGKALLAIVPFPFTIEAVPRVVNGVRIVLDCRSATLGVELPRPMVDLLEQRMNEALGLDVSALDIPIWIDELRCEPGRITAIGRARIAWPPEAQVAAPTDSPVASRPNRPEPPALPPIEARGAAQETDREAIR